MRILVTGAAGFIGAHVCNAFSKIPGFRVFGVDSFNAYYEPRLKEARVTHLAKDTTVHRMNIVDAPSLRDRFAEIEPEIVIHLAAQAGVRHSFDAPMDYAEANLMGQVSVLEAIRNTKSVKRLIYASSSSVYGGAKTVPFVESMDLGTPKSLYAASKLSGEILVDTYSKLYDLDAIGLRFFTVYGAWGRPDMAYWKFSRSILNDEPIELFNYGDVRRDFTYIDDVVSAVVRMGVEVEADPIATTQHRVYNIGNHSPEPVGEMIAELERLLGKPAQVSPMALPPGDMIETFANTDRLRKDYGFYPNTSLRTGLTAFVDWFLWWRNKAPEAVALAQRT
ncbi:MAG: NAD-dependent epimerase/dehydratase family protein [Pseudomonadota bacterium]